MAIPQESSIRDSQTIDALRKTREDFRAFLREWLEHHPPPDDDNPPWSTRG